MIILTAEDMDGLNLEEGRQIIVNSVCFLFILFLNLIFLKHFIKALHIYKIYVLQESGQEYVPCAISIEENSNYSQTES